MKQYTFSDGHKITTNLPIDVVLDRMRRLDILRVLMEGYDEGEGYKIYKKALAAYDKTDNFTGIIRLSPLEKDFLGYKLEEDHYLTPRDIQVLNYYLKH